MKQLIAIKTAHTLIWAFFVACILAIPILSQRGDDGLVAVFIAIVAGEVAVLGVNHWHCPLTPVAARFTSNRAPNFDIYLPAWLARYNKQIFGTLYAAGSLLALVLWLGRAR